MPQFANLPLVGSFQGLRTPFGVILPPGGRVAAYVRSTGAQSNDDQAITSRLVQTLAAGLAECRSGMNDYVIVLPGHSESGVGTTMLANLVAGSRIIGIGQGSMIPTFRWTATTDQWAVAVNDCIFANLKLRLEGANGVVKAILVTGSNVSFLDNEVQVASGASNKATIALEVGAGADAFELAGGFWYGTATHNVTDGVKVVSAVDRLNIHDIDMDFSATAANGNIHLTAAATKCRFKRLLLQNDHTASTACLAVDAVAATGTITDVRVSTINNGTATSQGITLGAGCLIRAFESYSSDEPVKSGILTPTAAT